VLRKWIDDLIATTEKKGRFSKPGQKEEVIGRFSRAQEVYRNIGGDQ